MDKLKMHSVNKVDENIAKIGALFPNCLTERKNENGEVEYAIDFDMLRQELSAVVVEGNEERYQFTWPDKKKSILLANAPIAKTLRPCREESVDFDNTENLYIEGDNLDVLKLLQETYLGKIKMIYIDPPYNTGNDFVYNDDFAESAEEYLANSGQFDEEGNRLVSNTESNGRFHTDWLNMIYPRLKVAKDLLTEDGAVFISIDDNEIDNLRKMCDEIFGKQNFVAQVIVQTNPRGRTFDKYIAKTHEYVLVYVKDINRECVFQIPKDDKAIASYQKEDDHGKYRLLELRNRNPVFNRTNRPKMFYPFYANEKDMTVRLQPDESHTIEIYPRNSEGVDGCWTWGLEKATSNINLLVANLANTGKWSVFRKDYLEGSSLFTKSKALWTETEMNHEYGKEMVGKLFGTAPFDFPKSVLYIKKCLTLGTNKDSLVLDFFSGSATTAHAVMQLNAEDGGNRKFIMVQLPEETDEKSEAYKAGYKNICEIGKERIRRAGEKIKATNKEITITHEITPVQEISLDDTEVSFQQAMFKDYKGETKLDIKDLCIANLDTGFRVLKLDSTNMKDVYYNPEEFEATLFDSLEDNIKEDRTPEDLLFQVMLDLGVLLSSKIEETEIAGKKVFNVADNFLIACFDENVTDETITAIAKQKPYYFVMRDSSMASDSVATNFDQIFATYSPDTVRKVL